MVVLASQYPKSTYLVKQKVLADGVAGLLTLPLSKIHFLANSQLNMAIKILEEHHETVNKQNF